MKFITLVQKSLVMIFVVTFASLQGMKNIVDQNNDIDYRLAKLSDVDVLFEMQDTFTQDDRQRLLVFPKQVRGVILEKSITKKRIYVAVDQQSDKIVGFVKLFLIDDQDELAEILNDELRLGKGAPVVDCAYHIDASNVLDFGSKLVVQDSVLLHDEYPVVCSGGNYSCVYLYYGGAYTIPTYREQGINTKLTMFAFEQLKSDCTRILDLNRVTYLALGYGQVEANTNQKGIIRLFADFVNNLHNTDFASEICVHHVAYRAYKPVLVFDKDKNDLVVLPDVEENKGQGNLAVIKLG